MEWMNGNKIFGSYWLATTSGISWIHMLELVERHYNKIYLLLRLNKKFHQVVGYYWLLLSMLSFIHSTSF